MKMSFRGLSIRSVRGVWKRTKIRFQRTGSPTSTIAIVKDRLCRLLTQHRQQPQPYNKGQRWSTSYKKSTENIENQKRDTPKMTLLKTGIERRARPAHPKSKCPAKDVTCRNCGKKRSLSEVLQKLASKTRQEKKVQTISSTWLSGTTSGQK